MAAYWLNPLRCYTTLWDVTRRRRRRAALVHHSPAQPPPRDPEPDLAPYRTL